MKRILLIISILFLFISNSSKALECEVVDGRVVTEETCIGKVNVEGGILESKFIGTKLNGLTTVEISDTSIHLGNSINGELQGYGFKRVLNNGNIVVGEWKNDSLFRGVSLINDYHWVISKYKNEDEYRGMLYPNYERVFIGEFKNKYFNGLGIIYNLKNTEENGEKGEYILGEFKDDELINDYTNTLLKCLIDDRKRIISDERCFADKRNNNLRKVGIFEKRKLSLGFIISDDGFLSIGQHKPRDKYLGGELNGIGLNIQSDRKSFSFGEYVYGERNGYVIKKDLDRNFNYFGQFKGLYKNGFGVFTTSIMEHVGIFKNDIPKGYGERKWLEKTNEYYKGNFSGNSFEEVGEYFDEELGEYYYGEFEDSLYHGYGILRKEDGTSYQGRFFQGKFENELVFCNNKNQFDNYLLIERDLINGGCNELEEVSIKDFLNYKYDFKNFDNWNLAFRKYSKPPHFVRDDMEKCRIITDDFVDSVDKCYGTIKEKDRLFTGTFENRLKNGFGYYTVTSGENKGDKFEGNWVNNVENGWGKYTEEQGFNLAGNYVDGELTSPYLVNGGGPDIEGMDDWYGYLPCDVIGKEVVTKTECKVKNLEDITDDGDIYIFSGIYENLQKNGYGELEYTSGFKYRGMFKNNNFHGKGMIIYPNKDSYIGQFKNMMFEGEGRYQWGRKVYNGNFSKGRFHGKGQIRMENQDILEGNFIYNELVEPFLYNDKPARIEDGQIIFID